MKQVKWGKALFAFLLSFAILCMVIPEVSYAAALAEKGVEESVITNENTEKEDIAVSEIPEQEDMAADGVLEKEHKETGESVKKEKSRETIDSTGIDWSTINREEAIEIEEDEIQNVFVYAREYKVFKFVPTKTKEYTFFSAIPYGYIYSYGSLISEDGVTINVESYGWDGYDNNFSITAELTAGETYYCATRFYDDDDDYDTASYICMISSTVSSFVLDEENIAKFEITDYSSLNRKFFKFENSLEEMNLYGNYNYQITCTNGQILQGDIGFWRSELYGVPIQKRFRDEIEEGVADTSTGSNAMIISLAGVDAGEIPIEFEDSPVASMELLENPWTEVLSENAWDIFDNYDGLKVQVNYTDGDTKTAIGSYDEWYIEEDDDWIYPRVKWKNYDEYNNLAIGENAIVFTYMGAELEVPVTLIDDGVQDISIVTKPDKTYTLMYSESFEESLDLHGLKLRITYRNEEPEEVTVTEHTNRVNIGKYNLLLRASYEWDDDDDITGNIIIRYGNESISYRPAIIDKRPGSISIIKNPDKMTYTIFDSIDLYGLSFRVAYKDGTSEVLNVREHGHGLNIGKYNYWLSGSFEWDDNGNPTGVAHIWYRNASASFRTTVQTFATTLKNAEPMLPGRPISISINAAARYRLFRFIPLETKEFEFSSAGTLDTYVYLYDANGIYLTDDDDSGTGMNFNLKYRLEAGKTYCILVRAYDDQGTFTFTLGGASSYTITYNLNGGTNNASNPSVYYSEAVVLKNPARAKYAFVGWYTDSACKNKITQILGNAKQNYVLYAKWQKIKAPGKAKLSSASNSKSKKIAVKYKKIKGVDGYEIAYAMNKKFKKASSITSNKTKATIGGLKKGKTYYVRICGYKLDSAGQMVRGKWSPAKKVTVKK